MNQKRSKLILDLNKIEFLMKPILKLTIMNKQTEQKNKRQKIAPTFVNNINDPYVQTALNYINNDTKPTKAVILKRLQINQSYVEN